MNKKYILVLFFLLFSLFTSGCNTKYGYVNLQTWNNISIYIDNEYKGDTGEGITKLKVEEGNHIIKISGDSKDGDWHYEIEKSVYVGADMEITVSLVPNQFSTEQRIKKDKMIEEKKQAELAVAAKKYGCNTLNNYDKYISLEEKIKELENNLNNTQITKNKLIKENGSITENDYIDILDYKFDGTKFIIKIKNKTNNTITYFWSMYYFIDENLDLLGHFNKKINIDIPANSDKEFIIEYNSVYDEKFHKANSIYLIMDVFEINYININKLIEYRKQYNLLDDEIKLISKENFIKIENEIKEKNNEILTLCE